MNQLSFTGSEAVSSRPPIPILLPSNRKDKRKLTPIALVDANNFYASCQQLFDPSLWNRPVIVLSNNDGCVVARNSLSKLLGIKMGQPVFEIKKLVEQHRVAVFSSNYALYASLSQRMMKTLQTLAPVVEEYSIDEAFLYLPGFSPAELDAHAATIRERIGRWVGLPVCVGLGPTKTLAKVANKQAKKDPSYKAQYERRCNQGQSNHLF